MLTSSEARSSYDEARASRLYKLYAHISIVDDKKKKKAMFSVQAEGEKEIIRRNICQAVDVPLSQMSDYERGLKTDSRGNFFDSPEGVNIMEAQNHSDTNSD